MNVEKLGHWMGVIANVGVFAGFLLVAYQLHQNTISLQSTSSFGGGEDRRARTREMEDEAQRFADGSLSVGLDAFEGARSWVSSRRVRRDRSRWRPCDSISVRNARSA